MKLALLGDVMLGRMVGRQVSASGPHGLFAPEVVAAVHEADLVVANLECCISRRGEPAEKMFVFRAPPEAVEVLGELGVGLVTLANNHSLDFGLDALADTLDLLAAGGIAAVGAGCDEASAREPCVVEVAGQRLGVVAVADHPYEFAARPDRPGTAFADLRFAGVPAWLTATVRSLRDDEGVDVVLVSPHWGANMVTEPEPHVRRAAASLVDAGATLVAGHSAHVFHGVAGRVVYDLGDVIDDYQRDPLVRNDLGVLVSVTIGSDGPRRLEALPLQLDYCHTALADGEAAAWVTRRFVHACAVLGTEVAVEDGRLVVTWP